MNQKTATGAMSCTMRLEAYVNLEVSRAIHEVGDYLEAEIRFPEKSASGYAEVMTHDESTKPPRRRSLADTRRLLSAYVGGYGMGLKRRLRESIEERVFGQEPY